MTRKPRKLIDDAAAKKKAEAFLRRLEKADTKGARLSRLARFTVVVPGARNRNWRAVWDADNACYKIEGPLGGFARKGATITAKGRQLLERKAREP